MEDETGFCAAVDVWVGEEFLEEVGRGAVGELFGDSGFGGFATEVAAAVAAVCKPDGVQVAENEAAILR